MGWICITSNCEGHIINGVWDKTGIAYFSISDEISILHDKFFAFILNLSSTAYLVMFIIIILIFVISLMVNIRRAIQSNGTR